MDCDKCGEVTEELGHDCCSQEEDGRWLCPVCHDDALRAEIERLKAREAVMAVLVKALAGYRLGAGTCCPFCEADLGDDEKSSGDDGIGEHHTDCSVVMARKINVLLDTARARNP